MAAKLAVAVLSIAATLVVAEVLVRCLPISKRFLSAEEVWRAQQTLPPDAPDRGVVVIRGERFREDPVPERAFAPGAVRLLFLGDSFTVGAGLERREARFTDVVEATLAAELPETLHVFNAGRGGSNPDRWLRYLEALLPEYRPHAVIAVFFLRDGTPLGTSLQLNARDIGPIHRRALARPLYGVSALLTFFWDRLAWREYAELFTQKVKRAYLGSRADRAMWRRQQRALTEMSARCRAAGVPFHLVIFPLLFDLDDYAFHDVENEIRGFAVTSGIPVYSLTPAFLGKRDDTLWVASNNQHPNVLGHRIAAERLLPYLRAEVLPGLEAR